MIEIKNIKEGDNLELQSCEDIGHLSLPIYYSLDVKSIYKVIKIIKSFFKNKL